MISRLETDLLAFSSLFRVYMTGKMDGKMVEWTEKNQETYKDLGSTTRSPNESAMTFCCLTQ